MKFRCPDPLSLVLPPPRLVSSTLAAAELRYSTGFMPSGLAAKCFCASRIRTASGPRRGAIKAILDGLSWLGITWDGDVVYQFARAARHREVAEGLLAEGKAYHCFATPQELEEMRAKARAEGRPMRYDGRWRDRDPSEAPAGVKPVIRLRAPLEGETVVNDHVQGRVVWQNKDLDDLVLLRSDGNPTYMLAVVVDDHDMDITHVIRGDDHLTNAARQTQIYQACGWDVPVTAVESSRSSRKSITAHRRRLHRKICCARRAGRSELPIPAFPPSASWTPTATCCAICLPVVRPGLSRHGRAITHSCFLLSRGGINFGIVGCAVGASFAVLIAEEMFASGCKLLISVTSSGQIVPVRPPPYFILIERALRDEGTSYHYVAASEYSHANAP